MTTNNHPAHGPVSLDRLRQISEILSKAAAQSDGGNLGYAMADAVKVIDGAIAAFSSEPQRNPVLAYADSYRDMAERGVESIPAWSVITDLERNIAPLYTAQPASVVPEELLSAMEEVLRISYRDHDACHKVRNGIESCRTAMINHQSSNGVRLCKESGSEIKQPSSNEAVTQIKPVADLYAVTSPEGGETSFTFDAAEAREFIKSGWSVNQYVELWRAHKAINENHKEIHVGWIPVGERMPDEIGRYWCYVEEQNSLGKSHFQWNCSWNGERWWVEGGGGTVTHWMPLPAAPQQEVKP